jgi:hypothetical protein
MEHRRYGGILLMAIALFAGEARGWGSGTHKFLNQNSVQHLPAGMSQLAGQQVFLTNHASDADNRKSTDPSEDPKHYIDLESFSDYRHLPSDLSIVIAQYGASAVAANGILPWAITATADSLTAQFRRGDWNTAYQSAADLGHYVADAYQPLHCTVNYNGQLTGNTGIHSRYESTMMSQYLSTLSVHSDSITFVEDVYTFALGVVLRSNTLADSILRADSVAKVVSGWAGGAYSQVYYSALWDQTRGITQRVLQDATDDIASLWYTAWAKAASTSMADALQENENPVFCSLSQNYPNPFNPTTTIGYTVGAVSGQQTAVSGVRLAVYDMLGREVAVLLNERKEAGCHMITWNATGMASGTYIYRIQITGDRYSFAETKRMVIVR